MKYTQKSFSVSYGSKEYRKGWDRIFGQDDTIAIKLYAILNRDVIDFIEIIKTKSIETLKVLYSMLVEQNDEHSKDTVELNKIGAKIVQDEIKRRELDV